MKNSSQPRNAKDRLVHGKKIKVNDESKSVCVLMLYQQRLQSNPTRNNESIKLELSRAWEPSDS